MTHTTEIIEFRKVSNGQFVITARCDGNASSDFPHTMDASVAADPTAKAAAITDLRQRCVDAWDKATAGEDNLIEDVGVVAQHDAAGKVMA